MQNQKSDWLLSSPIAHRGLWNENLIENSLPAYENAVKNGYPIEIDIYQTTDNELVCFHDKTLERMTGDQRNIYDCDLSTLKSLNLLDSNEKIPTLKELLALVDGNVPLLIELKDQPNKNYVKNVVELLKTYKGEFAIQSFNPFYINKVRKLAPTFRRGILGTHLAKEEKPLVRFVIKHLPFNFLIKPQFISYCYSKLPLKKSKRKKLPVLAWTITDKQTYSNIKPYCDNIIFEKFIPEK